MYCIIRQKQRQAPNLTIYVKIFGQLHCNHKIYDLSQSLNENFYEHRRLRTARIQQKLKGNKKHNYKDEIIMPYHAS